MKALHVVLWLAAMTLWLGPACKQSAETGEPAKPDTKPADTRPAAPDAKPADAKPADAKPTAGVVQKVGATLAGADAVALADLIKDPTAYQGKIIRVSGKVTDFCHHRRAWFAVASEDGKSVVRVMAAPRFEAPADCKEKLAVAEGKVNLQTLSEEQAQYYMKEHKFIDPATVKPGQPVQLPVIEAFGAEFQ